MPKLNQAALTIQPYWQTTDHSTVKLYLGHVVEVLNRLPPKSIHCVVTSPPYWGLRDYGTGTWVGGDPSCTHKNKSIYQDNSKHEQRAKVRNDEDGIYAHPAGWQGSRRSVAANAEQVCGLCGARRVEDYQIGSEPSPDCLGWATKNPCGKCFVCVMVEVFRGVHRVLRDDGTLWLNLGDCYNAMLECEERYTLLLADDD